MDKNLTYWDPLGEKITPDTFRLQTQKLIDRAEQYKKNPAQIGRNRMLCIGIGVAVMATYVSMWGFTGYWIHISFLGFLPLFIYLAIISAFQQNFILFLMCRQQEWIYNPDHDKERYNKLKEYYPDIFECGHSQQVEDQIWGSIAQQRIDFWNCAFTYTTGSGKSSRTQDHSVFIVKLSKKLPIECTLMRKGYLSFAKSKYKTESEEFNTLFYIKVHHEGPDTQMHLMNILSPSVQVRLIQMAKELPLDGITFKENTLAIDFEDELWKPKYTNFYKEVVVDKRDMDDFNAVIKKMTELPGEMIQFMD